MMLQWMILEIAHGMYCTILFAVLWAMWVIYLVLRFGVI